MVIVDDGHENQLHVEIEVDEVLRQDVGNAKEDKETFIGEGLLQSGRLFDVSTR